MKEIGPAVFDTISEAVDGSFSSDAVRRHAGERGRRPGAVPRLRVEGPRGRRQAKVDELKAPIISGDIVVESDASPK